jgi:hypothetical protein
MSDNAGRSARHYLLHCRPRLMFHLGHIKMLNGLYSLLSNGDSVTILIIPYDEHEQRNRTYKSRLSEEVTLTKEFYRNYLGFAYPQLNIVNAQEIDLRGDRLLEIQHAYQDLYRRRSAAVCRLIDEQNRAWASPNILFVPKCIAAVEMIAPEILISGAKHKPIADAFGELLNELGYSISWAQLDDFSDLLMETAMDRADSVHTYIDINDNDDFVLHKLAMLNGPANQRERWLEHFEKEILRPAPERVKVDVRPIQRSDSERQIALTKFLSNVRQLIPYAIDDDADTVQIVWSPELRTSFTQRQRHDIERIARQIYRQRGCDLISFPRIYSGKSGSIVIEVREHIRGDTAQISNVSILKIGPDIEVGREKQNYDRLIAARRTSAFMEVRVGSYTVQGTTGIVYQDANQYLGMGLKDRVDNISALLQPSQFDSAAVASQLGKLITSHLHETLYKHSVGVESGTILPYINEFLPAQYRVSVDRLSRDGETLVGTDGAGIDMRISAPVEVTEVDLNGRRLRAYVEADRTKLDVILDGGDELFINRLVPGSVLNLDARVVRGRKEFYDRHLNRLGAQNSAAETYILEGVRLLHPERVLRGLAGREYTQWTLGPVHGDLHCGNVLFGAGNFGVIDYGKMRDRFPTLYDIAFLVADLKAKYLGSRYSASSVDWFEERLTVPPSRRIIPRRRSAELQALELFEYRFLREFIGRYGSEDIYQSLLAAIFLGRLKFNLSDHEQKVNLVLAHHAWKRVNQ